MLTLDQLKQAVHGKDLSKTEIALLCVAAAGGRGAKTAKIKALALAAGAKQAVKTNWGAHLHSTEKQVFQTPEGWELTDEGRKTVGSLAGQQLAISPAAGQARALRTITPTITNADARAFVEEAVACIDQSLHRSAIVLSWVGAVAVLQDYIVANDLAKFNQEAVRRNAKWKTAGTTADFARMDEHEFLQVLGGISLLHKNVRQELEGCLKLRNSAGHPTPLQIGPNKVAAHVETLLLNVFVPFT